MAQRESRSSPGAPVPPFQVVGWPRGKMALYGEFSGAGRASRCPGLRAEGRPALVIRQLRCRIPPERVQK